MQGIRMRQLAIGDNVIHKHIDLELEVVEITEQVAVLEHYQTGDGLHRTL
jgi:hypothetical protein